MANLQEIPALGTTPIPGDAPTGKSDYKYETEYETLAKEIALLQSADGTQPNWPKVQKFAHQLLSTKAKDLLAGSYYAGALLITDGYPGLATGLELLKNLCATFWEKLFPEKPRARENALDWLGERAAEYVDKLPTASESDREALNRCISEMDAINTILQKKGGQQIAKLSPSLHSKVESIPKPPEPGQEPSSSDQTTPSTAPSPPAEIDSPERLKEAVGKILDYLRKTNPLDPLPYRLIRLFTWSTLTPIEHEGNKTPFSGGDPALSKQWETALKKKEPQRVLDEAESRFPNDFLWLDVHFFTVRAMEALGPTFDAARRAVADEVLLLVRRLPDLPDLAFENGTPFASEATRMWIRNELLPPSPAPISSTGQKLDDTLREARKLAARQRFAEATAMVQGAMQGTQGRERFLWRLALARMLLEGGKAPLALPQLEALDKEIERYGLEEWETSLSVDVVKSLWQCYSSISVEGARDKAAKLYERLCRLDLTAAMSLEGKR